MFSIGDSFSAFQNLLVPTYIRVAPTEDGWGTGFDITSRSRQYMIVSAGSDGSFDSEYQLTDRFFKGEVDRFHNDIVYSNGRFLRYPEGVTR